MKAFIKTMRILNVGFVLGAAFIMWLYKDEIESSKDDSNPGKLLEPNQKATSLQDLYDHYKAKEQTNA